MEERSRTTTIFILLLVSLHIQKTHNAEIDIITDSLFLTEEDTLVSPAGVFELGFFRPGGSDENRYLGIWYKKISVQTVVWVANRNFSLTLPSSRYLLKIADPGVLVLMNNITNDVVWSTNTTSSANTIAHLDDTGNLVVTDKKMIVWQSFDYPTDTLLPGMKFGKDFLTGKEWYLSSWKSSQDPSPGEFTWSVDARSYPQNLLKDGSAIKFRGGPWNGLRFSGASGLHKNTIFTYNVVINETEVIFTYDLYNTSRVSRLVLTPSGVVERLVWVEDEKKWQMILELPKDLCDSYNICGGYGSCSSVTLSRCVCLDGTRLLPRNPKGWETSDWSGGCVRRRSLDCENGSDVFIKYSNVKLPDTHTSWFNRSKNLKECEEMCLKNCSCMAYANMDIRGEGSGCLLWFNDLIDIRVYFDGNGGQDVFVRMASSELGNYL
ncbi:G-type lectin S-receptor-like serine/threonine-protein kinase At4g27290 [Cynara cardunculus var. scolymus]|uniref:G-type lectin S-receptor-like serine/threonine-protein kinase At4g27290 n=1 Tax=Cynara cardunculus var. scolymus TaxID=59895 RepID=UPI000D629732|nr:G-type lectin S-receptor-like serine/threonine-protein kinase At4g27290 [Cynara cardunculus var. scolymus]